MRYLTLANQLTILRILLIPVFVLLLVYDQLGAAFAAFVAAGITDALDGLAARRAGERTALGAWLDPAADKLLAVTSFIMLTLPLLPLTNHIPVWLTILVISRDVVIVAVVAIVNLAIGPRTFRPSLWGKCATAAYIVLVVVVMFFNWMRQQSVLVDVAIALALALTLVSAGDYLVRLRRLVNEH
ncbi:MAG: CDP-alcohol phosphatidyltransferase family protein [Vicinamibacterales bacterium]